MQHVPNALTISRILVTPVLLFLVVSPSLVGRSAAFAIFVAAAISDYYDGKLARQYQVKSRLGQFLDPIADKVLVLGTFATLAWQDPQMMPWWVVAIIAVRDFVVTGVRSHYESRGLSITTMGIAKTKTLVQLIFLIVLLALRASEKLPGPVGELTSALMNSQAPLYVAIGVAAFTLYTGVIYVLRPRVTPPIKHNG